MIKLAGGHKTFIRFLVFFTIIFSKNVFAVQIYDYHTENFINKINLKILTVNSYDKQICNIPKSESYFRLLYFNIYIQGTRAESQR